MDASAASGAAVWEAMQKGELSPEDAWKQGVLDAATVQDGLSKGLAGGEDDASKRLRVSLGGLLVRHAPDVAKDALKQPKAVQLALADFYDSQDDEKAAPLYEALLKQMQAPYEQGLVFLALGKFWSRQKQPEKAQAVFERGRDVLQGNHPHFAAEMMLGAARAYWKVGNQEKANYFCEQVQKQGDGWMSGMALYYQAEQLFAKRDLDGAIAVLKRPVSGFLADDIQVVLHNELTAAFYAQHKWDEARQSAREAEQHFAKVATPDDMVKNNLNIAHNYLHLIEQWEKTPIVEPRQFDVIVKRPEAPSAPKRELPWWGEEVQRGNHMVPIRRLSPGTPLIEKQTVSSFRGVPMTVQSDNPKVTATLEEVENPRTLFVEATRPLTVQVAPESLQVGTTIEATLTVTSTDFPNFQLKVPVHIEVQP